MYFYHSLSSYLFYLEARWVNTQERWVNMTRIYSIGTLNNLFTMKINVGLLVIMKQWHLYIVAIIGFFILYSCERKTSYSFLEKKGISSIEWKKDTFGCSSYRYLHTDKILQTNEILRLTKQDCLDFFGAPNLKRLIGNENEIYFYINQPSLYCQGKASKEIILSLDVTSIYYVFDKTGKMLKFGMKVP